MYIVLYIGAHPQIRSAMSEPKTDDSLPWQVYTYQDTGKVIPGRTKGYPKIKAQRERISSKILEILEEPTLSYLIL